ncbi:hypothetical protein HYV44_00280 [Candidatus Microgenomates bacterium]|nr:hypothetical protein [Candidatus Microgenomates bacterium]
MLTVLESAEGLLLIEEPKGLFMGRKEIKFALPVCNGGKCQNIHEDHKPDCGCDKNPKPYRLGKPLELTEGNNGEIKVGDTVTFLKGTSGIIGKVTGARMFDREKNKRLIDVEFSVRGREGQDKKIICAFLEERLRKISPEELFQTEPKTH